MDGFKQECKLCDKIIRDTNFKIVDDIKSFVDVLLLKLTSDNDTQNVVCTICSSKLISASNYKSACLRTEDTIIPYVDFENPTLVDLKEVYRKEKEERDRRFDNREICRLCFHLISSDFKSVQEVPIETIEKYIPEINFEVTANPVICMKCHDALRVHGSFIKNCLEVEKQRNMVNMDVRDILSNIPYIKTEEIEIKEEEIDDATISEILCKQEKQENEEGDTSFHSQNDLVDTEERKILYDPDDTSAELICVKYERTECISNSTSESRLAGHESQDERDSEIQGNKKEYDNRKMRRQHSYRPLLKDPSANVQVYACGKCNFTTKHKRNIKQHQSQHPTEIFRCKDCDYQAVKQFSLLTHQLIHGNPLQVPVYQCDQCEYKSISKGNIKRHQLKHQDVAEVPVVFKCDRCGYKARQKSQLEQHMLRHQDPRQAQEYMCDECDYKSIYKGSLLRHQSRHKNAAQEQMHACVECNFVTKYKGYLKRHQSTHQDHSEVRVLKCDQCEYKTHRKALLKQHKSRHEDPLEVQLYVCDKCDYKCRHKVTLLRHHLTHRDPSQVQKYMCDKCDYQTIHKGDLCEHVLTHRDPSEVRKYTCDECDYRCMKKSVLEKHQLKHKAPGEVPMYRCDVCGFATKYKQHLKIHKWTHEDRSEFAVFKCDRCDYEGHTKRLLRKHQLRHKDVSEVQMYMCDQCDYKSKRKDCVKTHQMVHRDPSEVRKYKCDKCDYRNVRKSGVKKHELTHKDC